MRRAKRTRMYCPAAEPMASAGHSPYGARHASCDRTGLPDTILHIHAGMAVLMIARLLTRRSLGSFVPWSFVVLAEAFNEVMDRLNFGSWRWEDTTSDVLNTLFWPTVICLGLRMRPMLLPRDAARVKMSETA
jgi:hypothetical protein